MRVYNKRETETKGGKETTTENNQWVGRRKQEHYKLMTKYAAVKRKEGFNIYTENRF
jgi:hypothetical protein